MGFDTREPNEMTGRTPGILALLAWHLEGTEEIRGQRGDRYSRNTTQA